MEPLECEDSPHAARPLATIVRSSTRVNPTRSDCRARRHDTTAVQARLISAGPTTLAEMPAWSVIEKAEPEFAGRVRKLFDAGRHKTIATLRADGSPRISGIECEFEDGQLRFGSMPSARKGADLKRDPRFALHGPTFHPEAGKEKEWPGEAKIAGRAMRVEPGDDAPAGGEPEADMFVADITEVVITSLNAEGTRLVIESWTPPRGLHREERD